MRSHLTLCLLVCCLAAVAILPASAVALSNPANSSRLLKHEIDEIRYDEATKCVKNTPRGTVALTRWLQRNTRGVFWGAMRCEKWGKRRASLHAEGRAIDWHLDASSPSQRRYAYRLIALFLAPDRHGNPGALARRMGVQEFIWDCKYWGAWGGTSLGRYSTCYDKKGRKRKKVNKTEAHRDHIHIGLTKPAARLQTTFWRYGRGSLWSW